MTASNTVFPTPDLSHIKPTDFDHVYEPAEDTFLMLDALESEYKTLKQVQPNVCVEVGCGSGVGITFLAQMLGAGAVYFCTDINPAALQMARATAAQNGVSIQPVLCDLTSAIEQRLIGQVDVLLFNPPYVVTPSCEVRSRGIEASWAGGEKGREVTDRFLPLVSHLLSSSGVFYLVVIKENKTDEIEAVMTSAGLKMTVVKSRKAGREHLSILKFSKVS